MEFCSIRYLNTLFVRVVVVVIGIAMNHYSSAIETGVFCGTQSLSYSEVAPIKQFSNNLNGSAIDRGTVAFSTHNMSCGQSFKFDAHPGLFRYALFYRVDYALKFSSDTAMLVYADENNILLDPNKVYNVYLKANHISARGLSLSYSQSLFDDFYFSAGVSYLYADSMIYGEMTGALNSLESDADGYFDVDYFYTEDLLFDREKNDYTATGYTLDLTFKWKYSEKIEVEFNGKDLLSYIDWRHQGQTVAEASTNRIGVDTQGRAQVNAALSWQELNTNVKQKLPQQIVIKEAYNLTHKDAIALEHFSYDGEVFHRLGYRRLIVGQSSIYTYYDVNAEAVGVDLNTKYFRLGVFTDDADVDKAKMFGVMLSTHATLRF